MRVMSVVQERMYHQMQVKYSTEGTSEKASVSAGNDFSPEAVSKRIVGFVGNYMERLKESGEDDERLKDVLNTARESVAKGLEDAKEKLTALNWLNEGVTSQIDATEERIFSGLDELEKRFFSDGDEPQQTTPSNEVAVAGAAMVSQTEYAASSSSAIQIQTRDGDVVNLNMASLQSYQRGAYAEMQQGSDGSAFRAGYYESSRSEFAFEFSLDGELDESEVEAINQLVADLADVADEFFSGDMAAAFEQGMKLGYNTDELAGFAMNLQYSQSYRSSQMASAYGQGQANGPGRSVIQPLRDYNDSLENAVQKVEEQFSNARDMVADTMKKIMEMRAEQERIQSRLAELFD
ncbi:predicted protein [Nematostella vectensis]|uniref:DUF5610 domain-containing protein n=1 Tax=Nematostella vectensis TaxID=45351 RepID=A8DWP8_NEMVE|nr:predicted protein [Nematostella vectensis]|eukprot:XP_001617462.1 hypothetical protein NEMVEDRAFT_v1g226061 [Nematostella vectensis]